MLLRVERYVRNINEDLREHAHEVSTALKELHKDEARSYQELKRISKEQRDCGRDIDKTTREIKATVDMQERRRILDWLTPVNYASQQNDFFNRRQVGTGSWLLESSEYRQWFATKGTTLFCQGNPGAGKTMLTSIVVNNIISAFHGSKSGLAYIYCNFRRQNEQKPGHLIASMLRQLAENQSSLPRSVKDLYSHHVSKRSRPEIHQLLTVLFSTALDLPRVFIVVDALDECASGGDCRDRLMAELFRLQNQSQVNLFVTSRFVPNIRDMFATCNSLEIRATNDDLHHYLDGQMYRMPKFVGRNPKLQEEIRTKIVAAVDGMYVTIPPATLRLN